VLLALAIIFILGIINLIYRQTYSVSLNGQVIGYTKNKAELQEKINKYVKSGDGDGVAFVELSEMPVFTANLLKRNVQTNDDEIFSKIIESGTSYYKYYVITEGNEEKAYTDDFKTADEAVKELKNKGSENADSLGIIEKYKPVVNSKVEQNGLNEDKVEEKAKSEIKISSKDECVNMLYKQKAQNTVKNIKSTRNSGAYKDIGTQIVKVASVPTNLGVSLVQPVTGTISSRFGYRSRDNHKGLDIAAPRGTAIKAACEGTVIYSGWGTSAYSGYGNVVVVKSGSSVSIIYGHCSALYVKTGQTVAQGQVIAAVGSTGLSTGNHLHFEIRYNGKAVNPQNYIYK
jgi:murein DD-endopeptidase MepM/ murein hydrolase activator NlpD